MPAAVISNQQQEAAEEEPIQTERGAASVHGGEKQNWECSAKFRTKKTHLFQSPGEVEANGSQRTVRMYGTCTFGGEV